MDKPPMHLFLNAKKKKGRKKNISISLSLLFAATFSYILTYCVLTMSLIQGYRATL